MKKILMVLSFILLEMLSYSKVEKSKTIEVDVIGEVLSSVTIEKIQDLDFGTVAVGIKAVEKTKAIIKINGNIGDKVKLQWKGTDGNYKTLTESITVNMTKGKKSIPAIISLAEGYSSSEVIMSKTSEQIYFKGVIENVPNVPEGEYSGNFVVRILAVNEN